MFVLIALYFELTTQASVPHICLLYILDLNHRVRSKGDSLLVHTCNGA